MNKEFVVCIACGSKKVARVEKNSFGDLTLGSKFSFKEILYKCDACDEEGDFSGETDKNYLAAQKEAQSIWLKKILEHMNKLGITMAMLERVFELPARTLTRWKNGDFSSSSLALLRILVTYPWIIEVAEHKFEKNFSKYALINGAAHEFKSKNEEIQAQDLGSDSTAFFVVKVTNSRTQLVEAMGG